MKVSIEIDCTPLEAREFMGLPDLQPIHTAMTEKLQEKMMANLEKLSPDALMQNWFALDPKVTEQFRNMFAGVSGLGTGHTPKDKQ